MNSAHILQFDLCFFHVPSPYHLRSGDLGKYGRLTRRLQMSIYSKSYYKTLPIDAAFALPSAGLPPHLISAAQKFQSAWVVLPRRPAAAPSITNAVQQTTQPTIALKE